MKRLLSTIKDLFDFGKPVTKIQRKLALVGMIFILQIVFYLLIEAMSFKICKTINWDLFFTRVIKVPIQEGIYFWWPLWFGLIMTKLLRILIKKKKINVVINNMVIRVVITWLLNILIWYVVIACGVTFGSSHLRYHAASIYRIIIAGIAWGWLIVKTRSLWPNILIHALWNFSATVFFQ